MKKIIVFSILLLVLPIICLADFDLTKWKYYKEINNTKEGLASFVVDDEMFSGANGNLNDVRIIDDHGKETPYIIITSQRRSEKKSYEPRMINSSFNSEEGSSAILDFSSNNQGVNRLIISTSIENFKAEVSVFGSDSMGNWNLLKDNLYIYDYNDERANFHSKNTTIVFPESMFRFLKIVISEESGKNVKIDSVIGYKYEIESAREMIRRPSFQVVDEDEIKMTDVIIDLGLSGLPVNKLQLSIDDKNFNRKVFVYSSDNQVSWKYVGKAYLFRYNTAKYWGENLTLNFNESKSRYLKVEIRNLDDQPLSVSAVHTFSLYREIAFQSESDKKYQVYFGKKHSTAPEYDLSTYFKYLDLENIKNVTLSSRQINSEYVSFDDWAEDGLVEIEQPVEKKEQSTGVMSAILVVTAFLLGILIWRFFRKK